MSTPLTILLLVVAVGLLVCAVWLQLNSSQLPWPSLGLATLTCAVCFTAGGAIGEGEREPDLATLMGAIVGLAVIAGAILALVPRDAEHQPPNGLPMLMANAASVVGALGLAFSVLTS